MYVVVCKDEKDGFIYQVDGPFDTHAGAELFVQAVNCQHQNQIHMVQELTKDYDYEAYKAARKGVK